MCTVTFIPQSQSSFILTSNRDEHILRKPASNPQIIEQDNYHLLFPRDGEAGGTWLAASDFGRTICLLNGAFEKHKHHPPYRISRGIVVLEAFQFDSIDEFARHYDFIGIEPFTMVIVEAIPNIKLFELRWDEQQVHFKEIDATRRWIWSSSPLYDAEAQERRLNWFDEWSKEHQIADAESIRSFHCQSFEEFPETGFLMKRDNGVQTVSVSQVQSHGNSVVISHQRLDSKETSEKEMKVRNQLADSAS